MSALGCLKTYLRPIASKLVILNTKQEVIRQHKAGGKPCAFIHMGDANPSQFDESVPECTVDIGEKAQSDKDQMSYSKVFARSSTVHPSADEQQRTKA